MTDRPAAPDSPDEQLDEIFGRCELDIWEDESIVLMFQTAIERLYYFESLKIGRAVLPREKVGCYLWLLDAEVIIGVYEVLRKNLKADVLEISAKEADPILSSARTCPILPATAALRLSRTNTAASAALSKISTYYAFTPKTSRMRTSRLATKLSFL